jgi:thiamine-monophosphate kinase
MSNADEPLGEFELIDRFFARSADPPRADVILGIGDDAALLRLPSDFDLVAAVDTLVAGRHFPIDSPPHSIGHRALAVNLSDLAAMGAEPRWATLALTLPTADPVWLREFASGLMQLADAHGTALVGGDTTAGPLTISISILGRIERGCALRRCGARAGDVVVVTGTLGDAGAGLGLVMGRLATPDTRLAAALVARFEYPTARVAFGRAARGIASAAMDLSDGLVGDLPKLAAASGLAARVQIERIPLSPELKALLPLAAARELALAGGDDYELLLTVPASRFEELEAAAGRLNLTLTAIGEMLPGRGALWLCDGEPAAPKMRGYDHFR